MADLRAPALALVALLVGAGLGSVAFAPHHDATAASLAKPAGLAQLVAAPAHRLVYAGGFDFDARPLPTSRVDSFVVRLGDADLHVFANWTTSTNPAAVRASTLVSLRGPDGFEHWRCSSGACGARIEDPSPGLWIVLYDGSQGKVQAGVELLRAPAPPPPREVLLNGSLSWSTSLHSPANEAGFVVEANATRATVRLDQPDLGLGQSGSFYVRLLDPEGNEVAACPRSCALDVTLDAGRWTLAFAGPPLTSVRAVVERFPA